eukprot:scaffold614206_cov41-Prasinocladus_malaysianus.AAC.1
MQTEAINLSTLERPGPGVSIRLAGLRWPSQGCMESSDVHHAREIARRRDAGPLPGRPTKPSMRY